MLYAVSAEIGALLLKCVLIVYTWPEKGVIDSDPIMKANNDPNSALTASLGGLRSTVRGGLLSGLDWLNFKFQGNQ